MDKYGTSDVNFSLIKGASYLVSYNISILKYKTIDKYLEIDNFYI